MKSKVNKAKKLKASATMSLVITKLATSCLDKDDAAALMIYEADPLELAAEELPVKKAMELPYFDADGKPSGFKRWRYLENTLSGFEQLTDKKPMRYVQPKDTLCEIYMPPIIPGKTWREVQKDPSAAIVITEGELKAACCTKYSYPCIGLGGVYSFKSTKKRIPLLQIFYEFEWKNRRVLIAYDSDAHQNRLVVSARNELCNQLLALGAFPMVVDVTAGENGLKRGLDDVCLQEGPEEMQLMLDDAVEFSTSAALHELNAEVAYVRDPGIVVAIESGLKMRAGDFTGHAYANRLYAVITYDKDGNTKMTMKKAANAWLEWPRRYELSKMVYSPGEDKITAASELNTWPGWGCQPQRGDIAPWRELLDYLFGKGTPERNWFERWCALPLQRPGSKMYTAAVVWGVKTGTGKSLLGVTLGRIYGKNYALIGDTELQDQRNEWAQNKQFVLGDDVTGHEQRKYADKLKAMITQETMRIDPKYIPSFSVRDCINYLFTSNHPDAFFLEDDDRRSWVHEVTASPMPRQFYKDYLEWLKKDGARHLFYHLLHLNLDGMDAEDRAPDTASRRSMIDDGLSDIGRWVRRLRDDPDLMLRVGDVPLKCDLWTAADLMKMYDPEGKGRATAGGIGREMKRAGMRQVYGGMPVRTVAGQIRLFALRNADEWEKAKMPAIVAHYETTRGLSKHVRTEAKRKKF